MKHPGVKKFRTKNLSVASTLLAMRRIVKSSGITQKQLLKALEEVHKDIYAR